MFCWNIVCHLNIRSELTVCSQFPPAPLLHNVTRAFDLYTTHAQLTGNPASQSMLAFFYSTGYKDVAEVDQAKALLYYTFAALGGDQGAQMALGYRYWAGIGVNDECMQALDWYQSAAEYCACIAHPSDLPHAEMALQRWPSSSRDRQAGGRFLSRRRSCQTWLGAPTGPAPAWPRPG